jgi:hypothetical protein
MSRKAHATTFTLATGNITLMPSGDFIISISVDAVDVRHDVSKEHPRAKLHGAIFGLISVIAVDVILLFIPGKHDTASMWQDMAKAPIGSSDFIVPLILLIAGAAFMGWVGFRWSMAAWPSDEVFRCDRENLTISRVPYLDFRNQKWVTKSYSLSSVKQLDFGAIASSKGSTISGIRFRIDGKRHKTLPGLEPPDAKRILEGLKALGANVPDDPKLDKRIKETSGDTSWMDRSWMNDKDPK